MFPKTNKFLDIAVTLVIVLTMVNQALMTRMVWHMFYVPRAHAAMLTGDANTDAQILVFSKGMPRIYGKELGISEYPDPRDIQSIEMAISTMRQFDEGKAAIKLTGEKFERYKKLGSIPTIACEFCCPVKTLIHKNGQKACGCAHSYAMRGLMKYLIEYHGDEFSDDEILQEMIRWKAIYFPKQMMKRYIDQAPKGNFTPDIAALLLNAKIDKNADIKTLPVSESIENLPDMAGGC